MKVALIERKLFGGTCVNTGCMPTKTLVASAYAAHLARRGADYGVVLGGPVSVDMKRSRRARTRCRATRAHGVEAWLDGMEQLHASSAARRASKPPHTVRVDGELLDAPNASSSTSAAAPSCRDMPGHRRRRLPHQHLDARARCAAAASGRSSAAAISGSNSRRCTAASAREVTVVERAPRLIRPRGRGRLGGDQGDPRRRRASRSISTPTCIGFAAPRRRHRGVDRLPAGRRTCRLACAAGGRPAAQHRRSRPRQGRRRRPTQRGYIIVDDQLRTNVPRHLGAGRLQRPGRLHPHLLQRLRDRRRQPARQRSAPGQRPHPGLCALHRSAARPRRHDRGRPCANPAARRWSASGR